VKTRIYVVHVASDRIVAAEVPPETAAALFESGHSVLLGDELDLVRVARRHDKSLAVLSREHQRIGPDDQDSQPFVRHAVGGPERTAGAGRRLAGDSLGSTYVPMLPAGHFDARTVGSARVA
jgi:hypothetical protein